jgi:hypothetical protein
MLKLVNNSCYFEIIINALHEALTELDIKHEVVKNYSLVDNNNIYLICTTHENALLPKRYISYNFEQLITTKVWEPIFFQNLAKAEIVFDYSLENIKELEKYNIKAHFLPLGYSKNMEYNDNDNVNFDKTVDFSFLGSINNSRYDKLKTLISIYGKKKDKLVISNNYWGDDLKQLYKKTKIGLNIHYYSGKTILEVHRILPLIANKILVISDKSDDSWYDEKYCNLINFYENKINSKVSSDNDFTLECLKVLQNYNNEIIEKRYQDLINNHKYIDYVKNIIHLLK